MRIELDGRTALVTGSTAGIGRAIATGLARAGATVLVNGRDEARTAAAAAEIAEETGAAGRLRALAGDVGTADGCAAVIAAAPDVDILVNNAGIFVPTPLFELTDEAWERTFAVNVMSGVRLTRHHAPRMARRGWGRVVFISSESALQIPVEMVDYGMSKTAQLAVSRGTAEALSGTGVTVNAVLPGPTLTEGVAAMLRARGVEGDLQAAGRAFVAEQRPTSLIERLATPEEVANLVVYVASPQTSATSGAALRVDGGVVRAIP